MSISIESLKEAVQIKEQIAALETRLNKILGNSPVEFAPASAPVPVSKGRKQMSAAAREKIAAAQRARWAKSKGSSAAPAKAAVKTKGGLTPEGRARLAEAMRNRWAARKGK